MLLHIDVVNRVATYQKRDGCIVCGNGDYKIKFNFDSEWNGVVKQAVVIVNGIPTYVDISETSKMLFTNVGVIDSTGTVQTVGSEYAEKKHSDIISLATLADGDEGYCVGHFDPAYDHYPKVVFFSGKNLSSFIMGLNIKEIGDKETLTAAEVRALAATVPGATHVAFNSDYESSHEDCVYYGDSECDVPIIRNTDKIVVGVHSESANLTTTGTEIPCKKSVLCT